MRKKIIILTGNELRHKYFRVKMSNDERFDVIHTYCESDELSLKNRTLKNENSGWLELQHAYAREQSEIDFFQDYLDAAADKSNPIFIKKGSINDFSVVKGIEQQNVDLLVCYGASLINPKLIEIYNKKFLNVHLGLSPYYKGSGTNIFPIIDKRPDLVGATFMHIDQGIDTGNIIHQIRADFFVGDSVHSVGNRLIKKMTKIYANLVSKFDDLQQQDQPEARGKTYFMKDFDGDVCEELYKCYQSDLIFDYVRNGSMLNNRVRIIEDIALK